MKLAAIAAIAALSGCATTQVGNVSSGDTNYDLGRFVVSSVQPLSQADVSRCAGEGDRVFWAKQTSAPQGSALATASLYAGLEFERCMVKLGYRVK